MAASIFTKFFMLIQLYLSPARYPLYSWIGWNNVSVKFLVQGNTTAGVALHSPINTASWVDWNNVNKVPRSQEQQRTAPSGNQTRAFWITG